MEKEKLSERLAALVGENSLSARTFNDYLDNSVIPFLPAEEGQLDDYLSKHANALKSIAGQLNYEVATKVNDFKKSYTPDVKKPDDDPQPPTDKLAELESRLTKFEQAELTKKQAADKASKLEKAKAIMKEQGAIHEVVLNLIVPQLDVTEGVEVADLAKTGKALYDKTYSELYGDTYVPAYGAGFTSGNKKQGQDAYMKHLKETGRID